MTKARKILIASFFRGRLDAGDIAKVAIAATRKHFHTDPKGKRGKRLSRATIYRACKQLRIKTT